MPAPRRPATKIPAKNAGTAKAASKKAIAKPAATRASAMSKDAATADAYFAEQTADKRELLEKLRALVVKAVPDHTETIKWGVPFYQRNGKNICALAAFKEYVAINLFAPPDVLDDPNGKLEGEGKNNRTLKVRTAGDIDAASIRRWLKAAVTAAA
jgi:hypothetical protein